jgi:U6 snRNA-associated Sm-like protein LSm7
MGKEFKKDYTKKTDYKEKKETIMDFKNYLDKKIVVCFAGGREIIGVLKGFDQVSNLVMDQVWEILKENDREVSRRELGLIIIRGPNVRYIFRNF